jgi:hypothetical protein
VRAGFLWWQPDISFAFIRLYRLLGGITAWRDFSASFESRYHQPFLAAKRAGAAASAVTEPSPTEAAPQ